MLGPVGRDSGLGLRLLERLAAARCSLAAPSCCRVSEAVASSKLSAAEEEEEEEEEEGLMLSASIVLEEAGETSSPSTSSKTCCRPFFTLSWDFAEEEDLFFPADERPAAPLVVVMAEVRREVAPRGLLGERWERSGGEGVLTLGLPGRRTVLEEGEGERKLSAAGPPVVVVVVMEACASLVLVFSSSSLRGMPDILASSFLRSSCVEGSDSQ